MTDQPEAQDDDQTSLVRALFGHPEGDTPPAAPEPEDDDWAGLVRALLGENT